MQRLNRTAVKRTALSLALAAICTVLQAGNAADLIFDETALNQVPNGTQVVYSHRVLRPANADTSRVQNGSIRMVLHQNNKDGRTVSISLSSPDTQRNIANLPTVGGNPLVMVFLESTTRAMAEIASGSPFYIRNRLREALTRETVSKSQTAIIMAQKTAVTQRTVHPFLTDPNAARMGPFANLALTFSYGEGVPFGLYSLSATAMHPGGDVAYQERILFQSVAAHDD